MVGLAGFEPATYGFLQSSRTSSSHLKWSANPYLPFWSPSSCRSSGSPPWVSRC